MESEKYFPQMEQNANEIEQTIKDLFSSQNLSSIEEALILCDINGIDPEQYKLYYKSEEEKNCNNENHSYVLSQNKLSENKSEEKTAQTFIFHATFPFKKRELLTLSDSVLVNIINGCYSSYGSNEIIQVFNTKEYLAKMAGIINLKKQAVYLERLGNALVKNQKNTDDIFNEFIKYLDVLAYQQNRWTKQTEKFNKDRFSTARNEQKERIGHIPEIEKARFIESIFYKQIDLVSHHNYIHGRAQSNSLLMKGTRTGYVSFLMEQLYTKWNNHDNVK